MRRREAANTSYLDPFHFAIENSRWIRLNQSFRCTGTCICRPVCPLSPVAGFFNCQVEAREKRRSLYSVTWPSLQSVKILAIAAAVLCGRRRVHAGWPLTYATTIPVAYSDCGPPYWRWNLMWRKLILKKQLMVKMGVASGWRKCRGPAVRCLLYYRTKYVIWCYIMYLVQEGNECFLIDDIWNRWKLVLYRPVVMFEWSACCAVCGMKKVFAIQNMKSYFYLRQNAFSRQATRWKKPLQYSQKTFFQICKGNLELQCFTHTHNPMAVWDKISGNTLFISIPPVDKWSPVDKFTTSMHNWFSAFILPRILTDSETHTHTWLACYKSLWL